MNRSFFDRTLQYNWDMVPVDRSFDPYKVSQYLSLLSEPDRSFVSNLLNVTTYLPYTQFKKALLSSFQQFAKNIGNNEFYLVVSKHRIGSEHWLISLLWPQLRYLNMKEIIDENSIIPPSNSIHLVIIDDASYSGVSAFGLIDEVTYNIPKEFQKYVTVHLVLPFISKASQRFLLDECKVMGINCIMYAIYYMPSLRELMDVSKYYPENEEDILRQRFGIAAEWEEQMLIIDMPAIYFDHKVASTRSTFSSIYLDGQLPNGSKFGSLFKVNPSRYKIEQLEQLFM